MYAANQNGNQNGLVACPVCYTETVKEVHTAWGWLGLACKTASLYTSYEFAFTDPNPMWEWVIFI